MRSERHVSRVVEAVVVFEAADEKAARAIMEDDPAVKEGVTSAELLPFRVALFGAPPAE